MQVQRHISVKKVITVRVVPQQLRHFQPPKEEVNAPLAIIVQDPLLKLLDHLEHMYLLLALLGPTAQIQEELLKPLAQPALQIIIVRTTDPHRTQSVTKAGSVRAVILHQLPMEDFAQSATTARVASRPSALQAHTRIEKVKNSVLHALLAITAPWKAILTRVRRSDVDTTTTVLRDRTREQHAPLASSHFRWRLTLRTTASPALLATSVSVRLRAPLLPNASTNLLRVLLANIVLQVPRPRLTVLLQAPWDTIARKVHLRELHAMLATIVTSLLWVPSTQAKHVRPDTIA